MQRNQLRSARLIVYYTDKISTVSLMSVTRHLSLLHRHGTDIFGFILYPLRQAWDIVTGVDRGRRGNRRA